MYGGTKTEMERLIKDASEMDEEMQKLGVTIDADDLSFGNIINSISVMQERMKIAGTTQKEAAKTISGSISMMKASWQNFLTGTGSPKEFADSVKTVFKNISKNMKEIVPDLTEGLSELVKELSPEIPKVVQELLPSVISGGVGIITGLATSAPELVTAIKKSVPEIIKQVTSNKSELEEAGKGLVSAVLPENFDNIPSLITSATGFVTSFLAKLTNPEAIKKVNDYAFDFIGALIKGLTSKETLDQILDPKTGVFKIVDNIGQGLIDFSSHLLDGLGTMLDNLVEYLSDQDNVDKIKKGAKDLIEHLGQGLTSEEAKMALGHFLVSICQFIGSSIAAGGTGANAIDWEHDVGAVIGAKILKGIYDSSLLGWLSRFGEWAGEGISDWVHQLELDYLNNPLLNGTYEQERQKSREEANKQAAIAITGGTGYITAQDELNNANVPDFVKEQMRKGMHATGFYAPKPAVLTNDVVGEDGEEVLLPLDKNTSWMDKFAIKLDNLLSAGKSYSQQDSNWIDKFVQQFDKLIDKFTKSSDLKDSSLFDKVALKIDKLFDKTYDPKDSAWLDRFAYKLERLLDSKSYDTKSFDTNVTKPDKDSFNINIDISDYIKDNDDNPKDTAYDASHPQNIYPVDINISEPDWIKSLDTIKLQAIEPDWIKNLNSIEPKQLEPVEIQPVNNNWIQKVEPIEIQPLQPETERDSDDSWIYKLADMLDSRINNTINITVNAESDKAQDIVAALDEALRNRQIDQLRGIGGTAWT